MNVPTYTHFILTAPLYGVPAGATGQLKRPDDHHVSFLFDHYDDLVFDINDNEPEVWAAIAPTVNPSMVDPPSRCSRLALAAAVVGSFFVGWVFLPRPGLASDVIVRVLGVVIF
jgi:hypothetical protein